MKLSNKNIVRVLGALCVVGFSSASLAVTSLIDVVNGYDRKFETSETEIIYRLTFKINDRYSITPDLRTLYNYDFETTKKGTWAHKSLTIDFADKKVTSLWGGKVFANYFYGLPTSNAAQKAGTFGTVTYRPAIKWGAEGGWSTVVRNAIGLPLNRSNYQYRIDRATTDADSAAAAKRSKLSPNALFTNAADVILNSPEFAAKGLNAQLYFYNANRYMGSNLDGYSHFWNGLMVQDYSVHYSSEAIANYEVALGMAFETAYGKPSASADKTKFILWNKDTISYYLEIAKEF